MLKRSISFLLTSFFSGIVHTRTVALGRFTRLKNYTETLQTRCKTASLKLLLLISDIYKKEVGSSSAGQEDPVAERHLKKLEGANGHIVIVYDDY
jgi:hypothetical protein